MSMSILVVSGGVSLDTNPENSSLFTSFCPFVVSTFDSGKPTGESISQELFNFVGLKKSNSLKLSTKVFSILK